MLSPTLIGSERASPSRGRWISYRCCWFSLARLTAVARIISAFLQLLIGLVDAGVAIKVAVNHGKLKSSGRLPRAKEIILDFSFLQTLPTDQITMAELVRRSRLSRTLKYWAVVWVWRRFTSHSFWLYWWHTWIKDVAYRVKYEAIKTMLELESPISTRIMLDRAPMDILGVPPRISSSVPLLHGHAVNIDMALTATIAENRGYITVEDRDRILGLMSRIGFPYHPLLDSDLLWYGTQSITMTGWFAKAAMPETNRRMLLCQRFDSWRCCFDWAQAYPCDLPAWRCRNRRLRRSVDQLVGSGANV